MNKVVNICQKAEKTQIVLAGWSQGAQVVHKAAEKLQADKDGAKMDEVAAVVTFGDPGLFDLSPWLIYFSARNH